ncbi:MAG: bifunctional ADP-dependent NAD(P)H-hydrate dehydratase/NAD(P)H-hydrate epimerase [Euryarchaeota archaeon CG_4_9_14_3_um_filter_38_12]|nr:MAG: bifunctional ADP-dependent NAD(P)H-hydrate dehydratase/NAD(P)H-hydrate epimerase [Euryarchaeota archaeon CG_4_9_14_3_um_filter_38_12]
MLMFEEVKVLDRNSEFYGVPTSVLMENAGRGVADAVRNIGKKKILFFCGLGNNGGDGFVAARHLIDSCTVKVILLGSQDSIKTENAKENYGKIKNIVEEINNVNISDEIKKSDIVVDSMLGVGISGRIRQPYLKCINSVNKSRKTVVSVDVPTGLGTKTAVKPKITVTFHDIKEGMNEKNSGKIIIKSIGIPEDAERYVGPGEMVYYPKPKKGSHKGENGIVLIIGGGPYSGAPALAGLAAYRTGVDLVHIATPKKTYPIIASYSPNLIVAPLSSDVLVEEDVKQILSLSSKVDSVIIGPGLGNADETVKAIRTFVKKCNKPLVVDASAFDALTIDDIKNKNGVVTPHRNEFKRLTGTELSDDVDKNVKVVERFAKKTRMTILLKGSIDIISNGRKTKLNRTGNPGMSVGGTGDVLSGIAGGLLAKGISSFNAARMGAFINGYAGDLAFEEKSYSLMATDVVEKIPGVLKRFL